MFSWWEQKCKRKVLIASAWQAFTHMTSTNIPWASHMTKPNTSPLGKYTSPLWSGGRGIKAMLPSATIELSSGGWAWLLLSLPPWCFCPSSPTLPILVPDLSRSKNREAGGERGRRILTWYGGHHLWAISERSFTLLNKWDKKQNCTGAPESIFFQSLLSALCVTLIFLQN